MQTLWIIFAVGGLLVGLLGTLTIVTLLIAGGANSTPDQIRTLKLLTLVALVAQLAILAGSVWLIWAGRPAWAGLLGAAPMLFVIGAIVLLSVQQAFRR
ncbi:MAG: hypothetical protein QM770_12105 [Tepidisphaeraceae bacterium]